MTTNDEIIKKNADFIDYEDYDEMCRRFDVMLNEARADAAKKERERILKSGEYVSRSFMKLEIKQARADERQRCIEIVKSLKVVVKYSYEGDIVQSFSCPFCESMDSRREGLKDKSEAEIRQFDSECDAHFENGGCECYICYGYEKLVMVNKDELVAKLSDKVD